MTRTRHRIAPSVKSAAAALAAAVVSATLHAGPPPPVHDEQDLPPELLTQPLVIYNRPYTGAVYSDYVPSAGDVEAPFAPAMARAEYEPMQIGVYVPAGQETLQDVTIELSCAVPCAVGRIHHFASREEMGWMVDLPDSQGKSWHAPCDPKLIAGRRARMPLHVLPVARIPSIEPGRSGAFWLTFKTDAATEAGRYAGTFTIRARGAMRRTVAFTLDVHPFVLPRPKVHYGMYYLPYQTPNAFRGPAFQKLYLADMVAHGMNFLDVDVHMPLLAQEGYSFQSSTPLDPAEANAWNSKATRAYLDSTFTPGDYQADGGYNALKLIGRRIRTGVAAGLIQRDHPCVAFAAGKVDDKAGALALLEQCRSAGNWPQFLLYMRDEPGRDVYADVTDWVGQWKRLGGPGIAAMSGQAAFMVGHVHNVWTVLSGQITPELLREAQRLRAQVWTYDFNLRTTNAEANRFSTGLYVWAFGLKGNMPFAYMSCDKQHQHPYFDANWKMSRPGGLGFAVPSAAGPVPGVGFEGWREGVDDVRTLQLLETRAAAAGKAHPVAQEVKNWLARLRTRCRKNRLQMYRYNAWGADYLDPHQDLAPGDYDAVRAQATQYILQLPAVVGEENPEPQKWTLPPVPPPESDAYAGATAAQCLAALRNGTVAQKRQAASALALREPKEALPALQELVGLLDEPQVRMVALRALARLGPRAAPAVPRLQLLLGSDDAFVRMAVAFVLSTIGQDAVTALEQCARDAEKDIAELAREALKALEQQ